MQKTGDIGGGRQFFILGFLSTADLYFVSKLIWPWITSTAFFMPITVISG
jgi:hypothetical protein